MGMVVKRKPTGPVPGQPKAKAVKANGKEFRTNKGPKLPSKEVENILSRKDDEEYDFEEFEGFGSEDGGNESSVSMDDIDDKYLEGMEGGEEIEEDDEESEEEMPRKKKKSDKSTNIEKENETNTHAAQRALAKERKMAKPNANKVHEAKKLWESLRLSKQSKTERQAQVDQLFSIITGDIPSLVFGHSASRVVQTAVKYGTPEQRRAIAQELKGRYIELAKSKYGKFLVLKILEYGNEDVRNLVLSEFKGNIVRLISHKEAGIIVNDIYRDICTPNQKLEFLQELYGPEFRLFKNEKDMTLAEIIDGKPTKKEMISKNLVEMVKNCMKKDIINLDLVHTALLQALQISSLKLIEELITLFKDQIHQLVHTKDGSHAACLLISHASAKDRKSMVKSLREIIPQMGTDAHGHTVLLALLGVVDDTKLVSKAIQAELQGRWSDVIWNKWGRRVVLFLCREDGKDPLVKECREKSIGTSKKDVEVRRQELLEVFSGELLGVLEGEAGAMMRDPLAAQVVQEILLFARVKVGADLPATQPPSKQNRPTAHDNKPKVVDAVVFLASGDPSDEKHILQNPFTARIYKTLVQGGHYNPKKKKIEVVDPDLNFATKLYDAIRENISQWATGEGSFVIVALLEALQANKQEALVQDLKRHEKTIKEKAASNKGTKLILEKIAQVAIYPSVSIG